MNVTLLQPVQEFDPSRRSVPAIPTMLVSSQLTCVKHACAAATLPFHSDFGHGSAAGAHTSLPLNIPRKSAANGNGSYHIGGIASCLRAAPSLFLPEVAFNWL